MTDAAVYDLEAKEIGQVHLKKEVFGIKPNSVVVHQYVVAYLSNQRQGTHSTLTRATMSGGGKKPWRQKGTGRARAGSNTSPVWVGGGQAHGPHPNRDYTIRLPKKVKHLALKSALSDKASENRIKILDEIKLEQPKTKTMVACFDKLGLKDQKILFLYEGKEQNLLKSLKNIPSVFTLRAPLTNAYAILNSDYLVMTKKAHKAVEEVLAG
ncbi:MAG: 50S ribosomal protein L4 [candidate division Zixibacteria bacterium RBG_16_50_21]|jgi:large subunit ribosomal protein L4|nr:MAG: 50S ribosomal protein L4 [candidate division Zixibacteria bacterium RBG_16_50_21]